MVNNSEAQIFFNITPHPESPFYTVLSIKVPQEPIAAMYQLALNSIKQDIHTFGFTKGSTPESYISTTYKPLLMDHLKHFFLRYCINAMLQKGISEHKIIALSVPLAQDMKISINEHGLFTFMVNTSKNPVHNEWKKLHFKAPGRKNYKDLDRQVEFFLKEEEKKQLDTKKHNSTLIALSDWICITIELVDQEKNAILPPLAQKVWLRIGEEETDRQAQELFLGKKVGDSFISDSDFFQDNVSDTFTTHYLFNINILHHVPAHFFNLEKFKNHFKLKTGKETHQKLIEVFSFRHDISQRRETIEKLFKLLFHYYPVSIEPQIIARQEKIVLSRVQENPDYHVYKNLPDFKEKVAQLAEKQIKEILFIDSIAYQENIKATDEDIINYMHFFKRPRTKEFIYFDIPHSLINDQETAVCHELIRNACQREKTLNYIIQYLTKKS